MPRISTLVLTLAVLASPLAAADRGLYFNAKYGKSDINASFGDTFQQVIDGREDSRAYELGFRFANYFAVQVGYHDFDRTPGIGSPCTDDDPTCVEVVTPVAGETTAYSASLVPQLALTRSFTLFGKIGIAAWKSQVDVVLDDTSDFLDDFNGEDVIYGAGLRLRLLGPLAVFYEYEYLGSDIKSQYLGASLIF